MKTIQETIKIIILQIKTIIIYYNKDKKLIILKNKMDL